MLNLIVYQEQGNTFDFKSRDYNANNNNIRNILSLRPEGNVGGIGTTSPQAGLHHNNFQNINVGPLTFY